MSGHGQVSICDVSRVYCGGSRGGKRSEDGWTLADRFISGRHPGPPRTPTELDRCALRGIQVHTGWGRVGKPYERRLMLSKFRVGDISKLAGFDPGLHACEASEVGLCGSNLNAYLPTLSAGRPPKSLSWAIVHMSWGEGRLTFYLLTSSFNAYLKR